MNWQQRLGGAIFGKVFKSLSEQENDADMKEFDSEATKVAGELADKEARIVALEADVATEAAAKVKAADDLATANAKIAAMQAELNAFGATKEAREAYQAEHVRLSGWYDEHKGKMDEKGQDATTKTDGMKAEEKKSDKRAALKDQYKGLL